MFESKERRNLTACHTALSEINAELERATAELKDAPGSTELADVMAQLSGRRAALLSVAEGVNSAYKMSERRKREAS